MKSFRRIGLFLYLLLAALMADADIVRLRHHEAGDFLSAWGNVSQQGVEMQENHVRSFGWILEIRQDTPPLLYRKNRFTADPFNEWGQFPRGEEYSEPVIAYGKVWIFIHRAKRWLLYYAPLEAIQLRWNLIESDFPYPVNRFYLNENGDPAVESHTDTGEKLIISSRFTGDKRSVTWDAVYPDSEPDDQVVKNVIYGDFQLRQPAQLLAFTWKLPRAAKGIVQYRVARDMTQPFEAWSVPVRSESIQLHQQGQCFQYRMVFISPVDDIHKNLPEFILSHYQDIPKEPVLLTRRDSSGSGSGRLSIFGENEEQESQPEEQNTHDQSMQSYDEELPEEKDFLSQDESQETMHSEHRDEVDSEDEAIQDNGIISSGNPTTDSTKNEHSENREKDETWIEKNGINKQTAADTLFSQNDKPVIQEDEHPEMSSETENSSPENKIIPASEAKSRAQKGAETQAPQPPPTHAPGDDKQPEDSAESEMEAAETAAEQPISDPELVTEKQLSLPEASAETKELQPPQHVSDLPAVPRAAANAANSGAKLERPQKHGNQSISDSGEQTSDSDLVKNPVDLLPENNPNTENPPSSDPHHPEVLPQDSDTEQDESSEMEKQEPSEKGEIHPPDNTGQETSSAGRVEDQETHEVDIPVVTIRAGDDGNKDDNRAAVPGESPQELDGVLTLPVNRDRGGHGLISRVNREKLDEATHAIISNYGTIAMRISSESSRNWWWLMVMVIFLLILVLWKRKQDQPLPAGEDGLSRKSKSIEPVTQRHIRALVVDEVQRNQQGWSRILKCRGDVLASAISGTELLWLMNDRSLIKGPIRVFLDEDHPEECGTERIAQWKIDRSFEQPKIVFRGNDVCILECDSTGQMYQFSYDLSEDREELAGKTIY